jgi:hypothetical protein
VQDPYGNGVGMRRTELGSPEQVAAHNGATPRWQSARTPYCYLDGAVCSTN